MAFASGKASISSGMVIFTRLSVHCADKITATSSSNSLPNSSSVSAIGIFFSKYSAQNSYSSFLVTVGCGCCGSAKLGNVLSCQPAIWQEIEKVENCAKNCEL